MDLKKHIFDTIKEWQLKIGYREGNMKLYYPGESLALLLGVEEKGKTDKRKILESALSVFCDEVETQIGRIKVSGTYERYCLDIPAKGCAYVAESVEEPKFLGHFLQVFTQPGSSMEEVRICFAKYAGVYETNYIEEVIEEERDRKHADGHTHGGSAFRFADKSVDEYVYWVEENEFGLNYHRFTFEEYDKMIKKVTVHTPAKPSK